MNPRNLVKKVIPRSFFKRIEPAGHLAEAVLFNTVNGFPWRGLKVVGITGTNGKTTTAFMVYKMLMEAGYKVGIISTVANGVGEDVRVKTTHMTNESVPVLLKKLKEMKKQGMEWLVLETTSFALAQNRVWGVPYSVAVFTNLTHEHLEYHGTFENYRKAKVKLFEKANANEKGLRAGVVNAEDENSKYFAEKIQNCVSYGIDEGDLRAKDIEATPAGSKYKAVIGDEEYDIVCNIPGSFNIYNSLAAVAAGRAIGLSKEDIENGIASLSSVEGRMNSVSMGQDFDVIIDYAHTPDSFEKLFKDLKPMTKGKLIAVFGSAGRKDKGKRPIQGELAGKYCDEVVLTEEDDRNESGEEIIDQIAEGAKKAGKTLDEDLFVVPNRSEAIEFAVKRASTGDTVLLLGKGHEKTIQRPAEGRDWVDEDWDELEEARKALERI
jgi:UDP-N-acetylmuramoyl-L-alanyl-D-glutamate--2,6-diaminopimelate ligase